MALACVEPFRTYFRPRPRSQRRESLGMPPLCGALDRHRSVVGMRHPNDGSRPLSHSRFPTLTLVPLCSHAKEERGHLGVALELGHRERRRSRGSSK